MHNDIVTLLKDAQGLLDAGNLSGAAGLYRAVLARQPAEVNALAMLALIAQRMGRAELALQLTETALQVAPERAALWTNYATLQRQLERGDPVAAAEEALRRDPDSPEALDIAGYLAREAGRSERACALHRRAVALAPRNARLWANYALALLTGHDPDAAVAAAEEATRLDPASAFAFMALGLALRGAGDAVAAAPCFEQAATLQPDYHDAAIQAAQTYLQLGDWEKGWHWWEQRRYDAARFAALPRWQGQRVAHLLVHAEQGFGDSIHFLRFVPRLRACADQVTLQVPRPLRRLAALHLPNIALIAPDEAVPQADAHVPLMSLAHLLRLGPEEPPLALRADATECAMWRDRLAGLREPRIGLVTAGNPKQVNDYNRSLPPALAAQLAAALPHQVSELRRDGSIVCGDATFRPDDFMATAAWMTALDRIITVDTAAAHLAGSLGRPTWLLLSFDLDWRWGRDGETTGWYPGIRLFRQKKSGDWADVVRRVLEALREEPDN